MSGNPSETSNNKSLFCPKQI